MTNCHFGRKKKDKSKQKLTRMERLERLLDSHWDLEQGLVLLELLD